MTLEDLLRESWQKHAARTAVEAERALSYAELGRESLRLAENLRRRGVGRGERVLHVRPKGAEAVVGMLGILMAGGAYVPIDPDAPAERRRKIEEDCRPVAVVGEAVEGAQREAAPSARRPDDLAAVLYTSGSTGVPKGVCLTDANFVHLIDWMVEEFRVGPRDRLSNHAPYHFDLSIFDHFGAFRAGACVVPVPKQASLFPVQLARFFAERRITVWYSVPFVLAGLAERGALAKADLTSLRLVLFAGEVFPMLSLRRLAAALPGVELANLFGPTETNVCAFHRVTPADLERDELPIGKPAPGFDLKIEEGELLARGPGVMKGYWGGEPEGKGYFRTGDRVEEREGLLWYRGRMDRMLKIRGFRVEPGEIEAALADDPRVREAAVFAVPDLMGQKSLVAALALERGADLADIGAGLKARLPAHMIPAKFRILEALPRTPTGKVDHARLASGEEK